jgi:hypothetical protein
MAIPQLGQVPIRQNLASSTSLTSYYVATNPTPGTAIQSDLITAFSATGAGDMVIVNNNPVASGLNVYLDYVKKMLSGTAPTATTVAHFAGYIDVAASCVPSAGSVTITPVNVNGNSAQTSGCSVYLPTGGAAMTIPAASTVRRLVTRASLPTSLGITGDEYVLQFGATEITPTPGITAVRATAAARLGTSTTPVIIPPGYGFILDFWWLTQATNKPNWEWEIGFYVL